MTNSLDPLAGIVPEGYATVRLMAEDRRQGVKMVTEGIDQWVDEAIDIQDTMALAMGYRDQHDPVKLLAAYLVKPDALWDEQARLRPKDFEHDWNQYQELRARAEAGEFQYRR